MREIREVQKDWDFVENHKGTRRQRIRAEERLYKDIPAMLKKMRQLNRAMRILTGGDDED